MSPVHIDGKDVAVNLVFHRRVSELMNWRFVSLDLVDLQRTPIDQLQKLVPFCFAVRDL